METRTCNKCNVEKEINQFSICSRHDNKEYRLLTCKSCYNIHKNNYARTYKILNKDRINRRDREYIRRKREDLNFVNHVNLKQRERYIRYNVKRMFDNAYKRALKKNIDFNISIEDIIIPDICPILEIPIYQGTKNNYNNSPSLDRIDNTKGYVKGNIKVISTLANTMKNSATLQQLQVFCKNVPIYISNKEIVRPIENDNL